MRRILQIKVSSCLFMKQKEELCLMEKPKSILTEVTILPFRTQKPPGSEAGIKDLRRKVCRQSNTVYQTVLMWRKCSSSAIRQSVSLMQNQQNSTNCQTVKVMQNRQNNTNYQTVNVMHNRQNNTNC